VTLNFCQDLACCVWEAQDSSWGSQGQRACLMGMQACKGVARGGYHILGWDRQGSFHQYEYVHGKFICITQLISGRFMCTHKFIVLKSDLICTWKVYIHNTSDIWKCNVYTQIYCVEIWFDDCVFVQLNGGPGYSSWSCRGTRCRLEFLPKRRWCLCYNAAWE